MPYTGKLNIKKLKEEHVIFLRNQNILSLTTRGATTTTNNFAAGAGQTFRDLTGIPAGSLLRNVRSMTVGGVPQAFGDYYTVDYEDSNPGRVTFPAMVGGEAIIITFDYAPSDRIFSDFPRPDVSLKNYPRIGFALYAAPGDPFGVGNTHHISDPYLRIGVWAKDIRDVENYITTIRNAYLTNGTSFYYSQFVYPTDISELGIPERRSGELEKRSLLLKILKQVETI